MYSWLSLSQSFMMFYYLKLWECMLQKPLVPTARITGDCNQTWPGSGTRGCAGSGIFKRLWQTRGLENKVQLWPILSWIIRFCAPNFFIKIHAYLYRSPGKFLHFISVVATIRECITAIWSVVIKHFECSVVTKISEGIASRETIRFLTLR